ncbi:hypothetical protein RJ640_002289 [Escallonia rubra]|uniref:Protein CYCLOPS n=1 Tax=Escallonia rubra TaxID=112253 RepID=A0AA88RX68_9ASTE|nr:hypothetical protein RJ640_002289 [Escallonia rubra]
MVKDGNKGINSGTSQQNLSLFRAQGVQRGDTGKVILEMEGRDYSDFYRNTSEELFLKSLMEGSIGVPTMEMLGFKNLSHNFRTDSEELFKIVVCLNDVLLFQNPGYNPASIAHHRTRQASRRMSTELTSVSGHQHRGLVQRKGSNENLTPQNTSIDESLSDLNQHSIRNVAERGVQASNLYLAKAWFHSSQPMTRSRSSELRRRYAVMQNPQTLMGMEAMHNASGHVINNLKQDFPNLNGFNDTSMCETPNPFSTFMSPSNSSSSTFTTPQVVDKVSSVVSMLKGTLERKKLSNQIDKESVEDSPLGYYCAQEAQGNSSLNRGQGSHFPEVQGTFQDISAVQLNDPDFIQNVEESIGIELEGFVAPSNPSQMCNLSREPSQSESSAAAPVVSTGIDACDGPSNSGQTLSMCESSRKQVGNKRSSDNGSMAKDIREQIFDNLKEDRKQKGSAVQYGSAKSTGSVEKGDPTKKRRVERSRKMAEAKERTLTPAIPSDIQAILKRCENLEKEVRSLKLNLAFMNRKDSEQTKQIEDLQKQNEELGEEKERLLEEIERIISETGKM